MATKQYLRINKWDQPYCIKRFPQDTNNNPQFYALIDKDYTNYFDLYLSEEVTLEDLKVISEEFRSYVLKVANNISWDEAKGFAYFHNNQNGKSVGKTLRLPNGKWYSSKPIGIILTTNPADRIYTADYNENIVIKEGEKETALNQYFNKSLYKEEVEETDSVSKGIEPIRNHEESSVEIKKGKETLKDGIQEMPTDANREHNTNIIGGTIKKPITSGSDNDEENARLKEDPAQDIIHVDSIQYLMSGRDGETFFFEGSETDKTGASFKIEYDSKTLKGEYSLLVDFNNLKTINSGFRRGVIKVINNGTTIREASNFTMEEKGQALFSKQDKVWIVDKPLIIKLIR